jgi:hypothetical protein
MTSLVALPETVRGLPLHALVVHAVVVLVPLAALGGIVCAVWPAVRRHFGALTVLGAVVATALVPVATGSGKDFEHRLGAEELVRNHQHWAERMLPAMGVLLVSLIALVLLDVLRRSAVTGRAPLTVVDRRIAAVLPSGLRRTAATGGLRMVSVAVAVVVVLAALAALYICLQTGESGARAVWGGR